MKYGLSEDQLKQILDIIASYDEIEEAILFGSRAIDTYKEASDVDIAIKGQKVTASLAAKLKYRFEEDTYLPFFFDFVAYPTITNESLKNHIDTKGVSIYRAGWKECKLRQIYEFASGLSKSRDEFGFGYSFLSFKDVFHNYFVPDELIELVNTTEKERYGCSIKRGDVFLTRTSETQEELGMSCVALKDYPDATFNGFTKRLRPKDPKKVLPEFAGFYFRSPRFRAEVTSMASITTRASLNNGMLADLTIIIPPLPEQKAIASVLSSLNDKIDLLHRQSKTLEALAETLFRQWFVEEAHEGWEVKELGQVVETTSGGTPSRKIKEYYENGFYPWVKSKELAGSFITSTEEFITEEAIKNSSAKLLPKNSILIAMYGATVGEYAIISKEMACNQAICALKPNVQYPYTFLFMFIKYIKQEIINMAVGSAQQNISQLLIKKLLVPESNDKTIEYHKLINPSFKKMKSNINQIRTLEKLRDTLLPKLMSGEVRVEYDAN